MKVKKSDGSFQDFDIEKIKLTLERVSDELDRPFNGGDLRTLTEAIEKEISDKKEEIIDSIEIHRVVVNVLRKFGFDQISKAYNNFTQRKRKMREEEKIFKGILFSPRNSELKKIKLRTHNLCSEYNRTFENETEKRQELISNIFNQFGNNGFIQGPIYIHYGKHTKIGDHFFGNFNLTIQDDAWVTIGDHCNFGPNVTIVTPIHPMLPFERRAIMDKDGVKQHMCYAKPVKIGNDCWFGANVVVCPGVTIGDNCVIGAGSVVVKDIPNNSFAAGNPCRVIREITEADSMINKPEILSDNRIEE